MNTCTLVFDRIPRNLVHPLILFYREIFSEYRALRKYFPKMKEKDTRTVRELWNYYWEIAEFVPYPSWGNVNGKFTVSPKR